MEQEGKYQPLAVAIVAAKLLGKTFKADRFAEHHPCRGCGAPAGYSCINEGDDRFHCRELPESIRVEAKLQ